MAELKLDSNIDQDEQIARIVWAAHILAYLAKQRNHAEMRPDYSPEKEDDLNDDQCDVESDRNANLAGPIESIVSRALDCIAQLLSPSKGWHHVTATALREQEDSYEIYVARNDGFGRNSNDIFQLGRFCGMLEKHLSAAAQDIQSTTAPLSDFERLAVAYLCSRVDYWIIKVRAILDSIADRRNWRERRWDGDKVAVETWTVLLELLFHEDVETTEGRERAVLQAYRCVESPKIYEVLQTSESKVASKLWRSLFFLARPIKDCRLLQSIANRLPQLRNSRISPIFQKHQTVMKQEFQIDILDAWTRLLSAPLPASGENVISQSREQFKKDCATPYSLHAESQVFVFFQDQPALNPSLNYFGCSKRACFLCQGFLQALNEPINTRGTHGICYPAWGVPRSSSSEVNPALKRLEQKIVSRIKTYLPNPARASKVYHAPAVPQSSIVSNLPESTVSDLRRREETLRSAKDQETALREQHMIIDGSAASRAAYHPTAIIQRHDSCVMCNKSPAERCKQCKSCYYCSSRCQQSDWSSHKLLCKAFSTMAPQPSPSHKRAIFFPEEKNKPVMIWLQCEVKMSSDDDEYEDMTPDETVDTYPYLGEDRPFEGNIRIERNPLRGRNLGFGLVQWAPRKRGYCITMKHREVFLRDGSAVNRSILSSTSATGRLHHRWCGPMVALRETPYETYDDIALADFRHIIDYFVTYATTEVRESSHDANVGFSSSTIRGAKICCHGEIKLHGSQPHVSVDIPRNHSALLTGVVDTSPISDRLGMPLKLLKDPDIEPWLDPPGWTDSLGATSNPDAAFLMMGTDNKSWGFAPSYWQFNLGNVFVIRADEKDLALDDLRVMCYFARRKLQPMFEDARGIGPVVRTRQSVLDFITWENLEKCRTEMGDDTEDDAQTIFN